jgi:hypothetical protein
MTICRFCNLEPTCNVEDLRKSLVLSQKQGMIIAVTTVKLVEE